MAKRVTMAELARAANVDASTVSRALNDSPLVKPETKHHVMRVAAELGYVMHASARRLRRQSTETIGLIIPIRPASEQTISDPFYLEMVGAISKAATAHGYDLLVSVSDDEAPASMQRLLQTGRADGLILIGQAGALGQLNKLGALADRVVVWGGHIGEASYTLVGSDNVRGGELAAEHLFKRGRRKILFIGDPDLPEVKLRYDGLQKAHKAHDVAHDPAYVLAENFGGKHTFHAVQDLVKQGLMFDAVFAASDVLAMAAIHALQASGKSVPGDVSVVGYDNVGQARLTLPALTTIDQHIEEGGRLMVELLLKKLGGEVVRSRTTSTELIVRESS